MAATAGVTALPRRFSPAGVPTKTTLCEVTSGRISTAGTEASGSQRHHAFAM